MPALPRARQEIYRVLSALEPSSMACPRGASVPAVQAAGRASRRPFDLSPHEVPPRVSSVMGCSTWRVVHLQKIEAPLGVDQKIDGPGARRSQRLCRRHRRGSHLLAQRAVGAGLGVSSTIVW